MKRYVTLEELAPYAAKIGLGLRALQKQCVAGKIRARKVGKVWRVDLADLLMRNGFEELAEELIEANETNE